MSTEATGPAGAPAGPSRDDRGPSSAVPGHGAVRVPDGLHSQVPTAGNSTRTKSALRTGRLLTSRLRLPEQKMCSRKRGPDAGRAAVHGRCSAADNGALHQQPGTDRFNTEEGLPLPVLQMPVRDEDIIDNGVGILP